MTAPIWCELVCLRCAKTTAGRFTHGVIPRRDMKDDATRSGWVLRDNDWLCTRCKRADLPPKEGLK